MSLDLISNMLSTLKNASMAGRGYVEVPHSLECEAIAGVLKKHGMLDDVKVFKHTDSSGKMLRMDFTKVGSKIKLSQAKRISKPGRRIYRGAKELNRVAGGFGVMVVSTPKGIMSGNEARKMNLGGEVLCEVF